jgi:Xaa-Pro aminopeptidase
VPGVAAWVREHAIARLGFEDTTTTVADHAALVAALPGVELVATDGATDAPRRIKRPEEVRALETALGMTDRAFAAASEGIREGMTEIAIADAVREALRLEGSEGEAFPTIVASGPNAAKPHHAPGDRRVGEGEPIIIDMGARHRGYRGDLTRTVWVGQPTARLGTMYRLVLDAQAAAIAAARPGAAGQVVDAAARDVFAAAGLAHGVLHSVGHGLGLRVHEAPSLAQSSVDTLEVGNVITIEPGLYIPEWGGVRIEDVLHIEAGGARNLTGAPKRAP